VSKAGARFSTLINAITAPTLLLKPTNSSAFIDLTVSRDVGFQPSKLIIS
jgi:hypothetical protein